MDKTWFAICILIYVVALIILVLKIKQLIEGTPTIANKVYCFTCALVYISFFVYLTSTIEDGSHIIAKAMDGSPLTISAFIGYAFVWFVFWVLLSGFLTVLLFMPHLAIAFALSVKNPKFSWNKLPPWLNTEMWPSLYVVGAILAYNLILYAFGLTKVFLPVLILIG